MKVSVCNDGKEVFNGLLSEFLKDNDNDEWLTEECSKLETLDSIELREFSGDWVITKQ